MPDQSSGFTLLDLMVAAAIGALLVAVAVPMYQTYTARARVGQAVSQLSDLDMRIEHFSAEHFRLPNSLDELGAATSDPWGRPYRYLRIEGAPLAVMVSTRKDRFLNPINSDYDLYSLGADGKTQVSLVAPVSQDDIVRAGNGGFIGTAADF